jgi:hypothetical protein
MSAVPGDGGGMPGVVCFPRRFCGVSGAIQKFAMTRPAINVNRSTFDDLARMMYPIRSQTNGQYQ